MKRIVVMIFFAMLIFVAPVFAEGKTEIVWYGHASFAIKTPSGNVLLIDPWITNPSNPEAKKHLEGLKKADLILITHGHGDHIGDALQIAKDTGAKLVATYDLGKALVMHGGFPEKQFDLETSGNFGGEISLLNGEVKVLFVPALHSSAMVATESPKSLIYAGNPGGFVITIKDGPVIYHTGDTDLFEDMKMLAELKSIDIMLICIGDRFTMGPKRAAIASKWIHPTWVVPMHYNTFPILTGTVEEFEKYLEAEKVSSKLKILKVGDIWRP